MPSLFNVWKIFGDQMCMSSPFPLINTSERLKKCVYYFSGVLFSVSGCQQATTSQCWAIYVSFCERAKQTKRVRNTTTLATQTKPNQIDRVYLSERLSNFFSFSRKRSPLYTYFQFQMPGIPTSQGFSLYSVKRWIIAKMPKHEQIYSFSYLFVRAWY